MRSGSSRRRNIERRFHAALTFVSAAFLFSLASCASASKSPVQGPEPLPGTVSRPEPMGPHESFGPPVPETARAGVANPDAVVLILGPGMAQGFSCVGAIKAVHEMKIPVRAIYANEVCALVAALYLTQPTLNRLDWALMQFKDENLSRSGSALSLGSPEGKLESKLAEVFGNRTHQELRIPLRIPLMRPETGEVTIFEKGRLADTVRAALSTATGLAPGTIDGVKWKSVERPKYAYPIGEAWEHEGYPLVVLATTFFSPPAGETPPLVKIPVKMAGIGATDFKKRNSAAYQGKRAVQAAKSDIMGKIGRTE